MSASFDEFKGRARVARHGARYVGAGELVARSARATAQGKLLPLYVNRSRRS